MQKLQNYIDGKLVEPASKEYIDNYDPSKGEVYSLIPDSNEDDVNDAVRAAQKAFPEWSSTSKEKRSEVLLRISSLIEKNLDGLAKAESRDNGKPISLAKAVDIPRAWPVASRPGIYPCIYLPGKLRLPWPPGIVWLPNHRKSHQ